MIRQRGFLGLEGAALYAVAGLGAALLLSWAAAGLALKALDAKLDAANERATEAVAGRAKEQQSREGFQSAATSCGRSVEALRQGGEAQEARWKARLAGSKEETAQAEGLVRDIISRQRPTGQTEREAMRKELDDEIDRRAAH